MPASSNVSVRRCDLQYKHDKQHKYSEPSTGKILLTIAGLGLLLVSGLWPFAVFYLGWRAARKVRIPTAQERAARGPSWFFFWVF